MVTEQVLDGEMMEVKSKVYREVDGKCSGCPDLEVIQTAVQVEREMPNEDKEVARNVGDGLCDHVGDNIYVCCWGNGGH